MSKIVILSTQLGTPQIIDDFLQRVAAQDQSLAEWIRQLEVVPIIRECVENAINRLNGTGGIKKDTGITDYFGKPYNGKLDGVLKTDKFPKGLGIEITDQGVIRFVADDFKLEWKEEIKRLRGLFTDAFLAEVTSSILQILGYTVKVQPVSLEHGLAYNLEGVKQ